MPSNEKKTWVAWAVDLIVDKDLCPGPAPRKIGDRTYDPSLVMTRNEFMMSCSSPHDHNLCGHYKNEVLGLELPVSDMVEIKGVDAKVITADDADRLKRNPPEGDHPAVLQLRRDLHAYVDAIELRSGGKLHIPKKLLNLPTFLKEYFDVKE